VLCIANVHLALFHRTFRAAANRNLATAKDARQQLHNLDLKMLNDGEDRIKFKYLFFQG
jgi:hypothetical protein